MSQSLPTQLKVLRAISEVPETSWNALVDDEAAPFLEWAWLDALETSGSVAPASGWEPRHLTLWRGHRLVAAAPAYAKSDSNGEFVFDFSWATASERAGVPYYPKLVLAAPLTPATGRRFLVAPGEDLEFPLVRPLTYRTRLRIRTLQGLLDDLGHAGQLATGGEVAAFIQRRIEELKV